MANLSANSSKRDWAKPKKFGRKLKRSFYGRSTLDVAPELLGKIVCVQSRHGFAAGRIVETEAYRSDDPASHSCRGRTPRAAIMFGPPGVVYVYFIYGMYEMLNFVTEKEGEAGAVLIRAIEPLAGEELMKKRRKKTACKLHQLCSGPGKLCRALGIEMSLNGKSLQGPEIWVEDDGFKVSKYQVSPRIGITKGQDRLWRFFLDKNEFVSK